VPDLDGKAFHLLRRSRRVSEGITSRKFLEDELGELSALDQEVIEKPGTA